MLHMVLMGHFISFLILMLLLQDFGFNHIHTMGQYSMANVGSTVGYVTAVQEGISVVFFFFLLTKHSSFHTYLIHEL